MNEPELIKEVCPNCKGEGQKRDYGAPYECSNCDGLGIITTPLGDQVQAIIWRQLRALRREEAREEASRDDE